MNLMAAEPTVSESQSIDPHTKQPIPNISWRHKFFPGELLPWKGVWFRVLQVREQGLILEFKEAKE